MTDVVLVFSTAPAESGGETAEQLALALVNERLAVCVNVHGTMVSIFRWKGAVERTLERQLVIKTTRDRLPALEARLKQLHSYEVPEFLVISTDGGSADYLNWVLDEV
jgi:periplasmic divalent cation tolerance protein